MYLRLLLLCLAVFHLIGLLSAVTPFQIGQAELVGEVRDAAGAGVKGATVTVTRTDTKHAVTVTTNEDGMFVVTNLRSGDYAVAVSAPNFRRFVREGVRLTTGERIRVDVRLSAGEVNEEITVSADASLLRAESGSLGQVIPNRRIVDLPLNGRNFFS
ncbi:MAG TPA: carboxypeptidase-like regulatory domain-containing protein, partial [Blastocatellia bacterium]|nr:carboxypeptidase-like regulatory domain-containing protein [Blastocatellia bacterium]